MRHSTEHRTRFVTWRSLLVVALAAAAGCATPRAEAPGLPGREPLVRVGLMVDTTQVSLSSTTDLEIVDPASERVLLSAVSGDSMMVSGTDVGLIAMSPQTAVEASVLRARASGQGFLRVNGQSYRGTVLVRATTPGRLTVVNEVDMENYLLGVVPYEIGRVGPELLEASKAQAVAARTYAIRYLGRREALGFDVYATVDDQVYGGAEGEHPPVSEAVLATRGEILVYGGEPIEAFYHSTCSGRTAAIEEVWPTEEPRPYLVSVVDVDPATGVAFDRRSSRFEWSQRWPADELQAILAETLADSLPAGVSEVGELRDFEVLERTPSGRIATMRITTSNGTFHVGRDRIRWIFLTPEERILNSSMFDVQVERATDGTVAAVVAQGGGWGHGIGMCQVGAMGRATAGQDYRTILQAYYPETEIEKLY